MALFECKDCSNLISDNAKACPQCGAKIPKTKWWLWIPLGEGLQKSFLRTRHPIKSMAYVLFIGEKLSFAEVS